MCVVRQWVCSVSVRVCCLCNVSVSVLCASEHGSPGGPAGCPVAGRQHGRAEDGATGHH